MTERKYLNWILHRLVDIEREIDTGKRIRMIEELMISVSERMGDDIPKS